jgi:hypothetical protein
MKKAKTIETKFKMGKRVWNKWRKSMYRQLERRVGIELFLDILDGAVENMLKDIEAGKLNRSELFDAKGALTEEGCSYVTEAIESYEFRDHAEGFMVDRGLGAVMTSEAFAYYEYSFHKLGGVPIL